MRAAVSPAILSAIADLQRLLHEAVGPRLREVRLFGSVARGEATEDSDVDVLILLDEVRSSVERIRVAETAFDAGFPHDVVLSPLVLGADELDKLRAWETGLAQALDREGIRL